MLFRYFSISQSITSTITSNQPPIWFRVLQIVSGIISLILSAFLIGLGFPVTAADTILLLLSITLLTIGIERVGTGLMSLMLYSSLPKTSRPSGRRNKVAPFTNLCLGAVAILFAIFTFVSPKVVSEISPNLLSIAISVMFNGFARIMQGAFDKSQPKWYRAFSLGVGTLSIGVSIYVTNSKDFGIIFPIRTLFVTLLIYGIGMVVYGVTGKLSLDEMLKKKIGNTDK